MKTHSILPNRVVVRRHFTADEKKSFPTLTYAKCKVTMKHNPNHIFLSSPEAYLSDLRINISKNYLSFDTAKLELSLHTSK